MATVKALRSNDASAVLSQLYRNALYRPASRTLHLPRYPEVFYYLDLQPSGSEGEVKRGPNKRAEWDAPDSTEVEWRAVGLVARLPLFGSCVAPSRSLRPPHKTNRGTAPLDRPGVPL